MVTSTSTQATRFRDLPPWPRAWLLLGCLAVVLQLLVMTGSVTAQSVLTQVGQAVVVPRYVGDSQYEKQNLAPLMQWCEDRQERTVEEARRSCDWRHTRQNSFHFGASKAVYWLSVRLHNGSSASRNVVVDFGVSHEDYLDWYVLDSASGNRLTQGRMGDRLPMQVRSLPTRHQGIPVQVPASRDVELYVRSASFDGWHQLLQPQLLSEKAYLEAEQKEDFANGLIFGGLGAIVIVAFSAYTATRQRSILLYGLALAGLLVYSMAKTSYDLMFLWPNAPGLHSRIVFIVGPLTILLYTALVFDLLKARSHLPRWLWNGLMLWCTLAAVSGLPAVFDHIQWAVYSTLVAAWLTLPVFLTVCWLAIRQVPGAWMMVIAVAAQVVAVLLNALRAMGLLRTVTFDQSVFQMAGLFQALVLAYAMARILIQMRQEKLKAAQQAHEAHTRLRAQEEHELRHDKLTGLPNRLALLEWLRQRMDQQRPFAVIHIGIFDFKAVNDQFGHAGGDYALLELSRRCQALLGPGDMMAKQLSDQFILVLHGMDTIQALSVASQLMQRLTQPIAYAESEIVLRPRMGLAAYPEDGKEAEILLQHAHIAKREAAHLVSHIQTYHSGSDKIFERRNLLLRDLRSAIAGEQFLMVYQPKLNLRTGQVDKAEALLRWDHPQLGRISPVEFIPLVERADASWQLSMWVLERGIAQMAKWRQRGYHIGLALNLSAQDLHHRQLPEQVRKLLESYEVPAAQLTLEITESGIMQNLDSVRLVLAALCELGVTLSIDDFGTGYSSLAMLKQLPVKELKIDRAFVAPLERSSSEQSDDAAIIRSIIGIGHSVGMRVVAEGVETLAVARLLESWQCEYVQGYWLKPPLAADQFIDWLAAGTGHYITELQPALP